MQYDMYVKQVQRYSARQREDVAAKMSGAVNMEL